MFLLLTIIEYRTVQLIDYSRLRLDSFVLTVIIALVQFFLVRTAFSFIYIRYGKHEHRYISPVLALSVGHPDYVQDVCQTNGRREAPSQSLLGKPIPIPDNLQIHDNAIHRRRWLCLRKTVLADAVGHSLPLPDCHSQD